MRYCSIWIWVLSRYPRHSMHDISQLWVKNDYNMFTKVINCVGIWIASLLTSHTILIVNPRPNRYILHWSTIVKNKYLWYYIFKVYFKNLNRFLKQTYKFHLKFKHRKVQQSCWAFFYAILSVDLEYSRVVMNVCMMEVIDII
jgi:hypothetical protein